VKRKVSVLVDERALAGRQTNPEGKGSETESSNGVLEEVGPTCTNQRWRLPVLAIVIAGPLESWSVCSWLGQTGGSEGFREFCCKLTRPWLRPKLRNDYFGQ